MRVGTDSGTFVIDRHFSLVIKKVSEIGQAMAMEAEENTITAHQKEQGMSGSLVPVHGCGQ